MGTPAAAPMFESVTKVHGPKVISIVLSGMMQDGSQGTRAIKAGGGLCMAESVESSPEAGMPRGAIDIGRAELALPPAKLALGLMAAI